MTKRKKLLLTAATSLAALLVVTVIAVVVVVQTSWFQNLVRQKIITATEESTGGVAEIGAFEFDLQHLTVRIRNFVLHGTEPKGSDPLAQIKLLELRLSLFSGLTKPVDLQYLGITEPRVNLLLLPNGTTNIPQPKVPSKPSQTSGLETVVNLAVGKFQLEGGVIKVLQQATAFNARGENLRVLLNYNTANPSYAGYLALHPLVLTSGKRSPLNVDVNIPIRLEKDAIRVTDAKLNTGQSQILMSASMENVNAAPVIAARLHAALSLPELQQSIDLPVDATARDLPKTLSADLALTLDEKTHTTHVETAHVGLGQTTFQAAGDMRPNRQGAVDFKANFALAELARLFKVSGTQVSGALEANGRAVLDEHSNYAVDGMLNTRGLAVRNGTTQLSNIGLSSPFHADPYLISMDGLRVNLLGGSLAAKIFLEKLQNLSLEGNLRNFSVPVLVSAATGKHLGYDGAVNGSILAKGDLKAKGTTGYSAQTRLEIVPGRRAIPISGRLNANYLGARGALDLGQSYLAWPHSRLDMTGSLNQRLDLKLTSSNLNDFLPAANFGAAKPQTALPVTLQGGVASLEAQVRGNLSSPHISAHAEVGKFAVEQRPFNRLAVDLAASPAGADVRNGVLDGPGVSSNFDASLGLAKWEPKPASPLTANLTLKNSELADLASLAGESSLQAAGQVNAEIHVKGTYGNPLGSAVLQIKDGSVEQQPFSKLYMNANLADQLITLAQLELDTAGGSVTANGTFRHPRESFTVGHLQVKVAGNNVQLDQIQALAKQNAGVAGVIQLNAAAAADLHSQNAQSSVTVSDVTADFSARNLRVQGQDAGNLVASARTANNTVAYKVNSNFAGSSVDVSGRTSLAQDYPTTANASINNLSVAKALQILGQGAIPASGDFSANAHLTGTLQAPSADLSFALNRARVYQEEIRRLQGSVHYTNSLLNIPSIELNAPAGQIGLSGTFKHPAGDLNSGDLQLKLTSSDIDLAKIEHVQQAKPGLAGTLHLAADLSARLQERHGKVEPLISNLNADARTAALRLNEQRLGGLNFTAHTSGSALHFQLDSDLAKSQIHGSGQTELTVDYPARVTLSFSNIRYSNLAPFFASSQTAPPPFDALVEGHASVNGPLLAADELTGQLQLDRVDLRTSGGTSPTGAAPARLVELQNQGPIVVALNRDVVKIEQFRIGGRGSFLETTGSVNLKDQKEPLALNVNANLDLGLLQDADRDFYSSGAVTMNTVIRGSFAQPRANGKVELKNANVNYSASPNGLSNANGVILLNGTNATIQNLTGESGGGKITLTGFAGLGGGSRGPTFNLSANASHVRVRYSGISATSDANITLTGNVRRSLLAGTVTVERIAYASSSDAGSLLSSVSVPPSAASAPSRLLSGMRLAIHVLTAPDIQVVTTYANRLSILANLTVRGTAEVPGILGRVSVTDGQLVFFGNTYTVTTGTINFYNPSAIAPVVNLSLDTIAQGVDVTIGVSGPMNDLKLSYRSDPPLTFEQIVQLLATNTTPANPVIAAHQPTPAQQSLSQMGESAVLGQAVANPLASRVQRVFGLTQFKIDPSFSGSNGQPDARVTLQEKIASNITFTYITDVTQTNGQIIRIQWDLTNNLSAVGLRDFNGNVSIEFFYKFTRR